MMKKIATFALIFTLAATTMLAACGTKQTTTESTSSETTTEASMANPMQEVDAEEMCGRVGVDLNAPEGATDIHCYIIDTGDAKIAEMTFKLDGKEYTYRATPNEMDITELSGYYFEAPTESYAEVAGREGQILTQDESSVLYWEDKVPGICYSLSSTSCKDPSVLLTIAEQTFVPMQGEVG
ncbi:MAG: hypothetical protein KBS83_00125 [Lachnospiraceae bacterium]|nr:hypothetical protein [Candidatus Equihabitans merdae]